MVLTKAALHLHKVLLLYTNKLSFVKIPYGKLQELFLINK